MEDKYIPMTSITSGDGIEVLPDIYCFPIQIVNVVFVGFTNSPNDWVLIDAGMPQSEDKIISEAEKRFGEGAKPRAIILTHGHFDHIGAAVELVEHWKVPVYAHPLEIPYVTGIKEYKDPDPTVEGGLLAKISGFFPNEPINLGENVKPLPADGSIPELPGWEWIHTPGHTEGQVSLFRKQDHVLIAGDTFITVRQDELLKVLLQEKELSGPPRYFTPDWDSSWESVRKLEALHPRIAIPGHGLPMDGEELTEGLRILVKDFDKIAIPDHGIYVDRK